MRCLSHSAPCADGTSSPRAASDDRPSDGASSDHEPKAAKQLPFYALFPQTLPQGPPPAGPFAIDTRALRREFLRLQAAAHPDFHHHAAAASSTDSDTISSPPASSSSSSSPSSSRAQTAHHSPARLAAEAASATINEAYRTLCSPLLRAQYLLRAAHGLDLAGDETGAAAGDAPADVLLGVLDAREAIEAAERAADLEPVGAENDARIAACEDALAAAFAAGDVQAAAQQAVRLRYWVNVRESIADWEKGGEVVLKH